MLALAAGVAAVGLIVARRKDESTRAPAVHGARFVCAMHPEVSSPIPGECAICGMALVKAGAIVRGYDGADARPPAAPRSRADSVSAAQLLSSAAGGLSANLVGYYPSPVRQHVLRYEIYAPAWLDSDGVLTAQIYGDQLPTLEPGEHALFSPTAEPEMQRDVWLAPGAARPWDRSTSLVRFNFEPPADALPSGTVGWVKFARRPRPMSVIPAAAVLESPDGPYVLVFSSADGAATRRAIEVGRVTTGLAAVLSGLNLREQVVSVNAFFWDAERRLQGDQAGQRAAGGSF